MADQTGWIATGTGTPSSLTVTKAAVSDKQHVVYGLDVGLSGGGVVQITMQDGSTTVWQQYVDSARHFAFAKGIPMTKGNAVNVIAAAISTTGGGSPGEDVSINLHGSTF